MVLMTGCGYVIQLQTLYPQKRQNRSKTRKKVIMTYLTRKKQYMAGDQNGEQFLSDLNDDLVISKTR